ncbi:MAG: hypothetical protein SVU69_13710 [Pseudomonadota bacterium]|nr:hypothetical protein [Pseudomonadota bacterium]
MAEEIPFRRRLVVSFALLIFAAPAAAEVLCEHFDSDAGALINTFYDGFLVGDDYCLFDADRVNPNEVPALIEGPPSAAKLRMYYVNGANARSDTFLTQLSEIRALHDVALVGVYNAAGLNLTERISPRRETLGDPAADTVVTVILDHLERDEPVHLHGFSEGASLIADAIAEVQRRLERRLRWPGAVGRKLSLIRVETSGGVAVRYPDGPEYVHYVNMMDPMVHLMGVLRPGAEPGANAVIVRFNDAVYPIETRFRKLPGPALALLHFHGFWAYQKNRQDFESMREHARKIGSRSVVVRVAGCCGVIKGGAREAVLASESSPDPESSDVASSPSL